MVSTAAGGISVVTVILAVTATSADIVIGTIGRISAIGITGITAHTLATGTIGVPVRITASARTMAGVSCAAESGPISDRAASAAIVRTGSDAWIAGGLACPEPLAGSMVTPYLKR